MPLHLIKLCVGCDSIEDLASWQADRLKVRRRAGEKKPQLFHRTFQTPKRRAELLDGGSLYWVIKGLVQVRQPLIDIAEGTKDDGTPCCLLILKNELLAVRRVAIPGAIGQSLIATALGIAVARAFGWDWTAGTIFGLAISIASTVVLQATMIEFLSAPCQRSVRKKS